MGPLSRATVALLSVCLFFGSFFTSLLPAYVITDIDGSSDLDIIFDEPGVRTINISMPLPFRSRSAELNISGKPTVPGGVQYPRNVSLDAGNDGKVEWGFEGAGHGALGHQDSFSDNSTAIGIQVNGASSKTYDILLPRGSEVLNAGMDVNGIPTPLQQVTKVTNNQSLNASSHSDYLVKGIDDSQIALNATVQMNRVVGIDDREYVNQSAENAALTIGAGTVPAQNFIVNTTDPRVTSSNVTSIAVAFSGIIMAGFAVTLDIYPTTGGGNYQPMSSSMRHITVGSSAFKDGYVNFTITPPLLVWTGTVYCFAFGMTVSGVGSPGVYYYDSSGSANQDSKYPATGSWLHISTNSGSTWTSYPGRDLEFKIQAEAVYNLTPAEAKVVKADGKSPSRAQGQTLDYNIPARYDNNGWAINISNGLPFPILYNFTAAISFNDAPDHVQLDVGSDDAFEYSNPGNLSTIAKLTKLKNAVTLALQAASDQGNVVTDPYGIVLVKVPLKIIYSGKGTLRIENLSISYNYSAAIPGLKAAIDAYGASNGNSTSGILKVPIRITSSAPGIVHLSGIKVIFDGPPKVIKEPPSGLKMSEEGSNATVLDLKAMFQDDFDADLTITIVNVTTTPTVVGDLNLTVTPAGILSIDGKNAVNWSGMISVIVNATDSNQFSVSSEPINISVTEVNDPPTFTSVPPTKAIVDKEYCYNFSIVDSDSYSFVMWLEKAPSSMVLTKNNQSVCWTPAPADVGIHNISLNIFDGYATIHQNISIIVNKTGGGGGGGGGNRAPDVQPMANRTIEVGTVLQFQVPASDPDLDLLFYFMVSGPTGLAINNTTGAITWKSDVVGNFTVTVRISDGLLWVDATLNISVVPKGSTIGKPTVSIERPISGENATGILTMIGKATVKGTTLTKVEYSLDGGPWIKADLQPDGTWSAETNIKNLTKGNHTLVVRATDATGQTAVKYVTFIVKGKGTSGHGGFSLMSVLPFFFLTLLFVAGTVGIIAATRSKKAKRKGHQPKKGETKAEKAASPPKDDRKPSIDSAFLVYHDGRLITYHSQSEIEDLDATLQVIKDFVKASFRGDVGRLDSLRYENMNIILERGVQMYLVVITPEEDTVVHQSLRKRMRSFLGDVHERYRHILKVWDGKYKSVKPIEKMVGDYVDGKWAKSAGKDPKEGPAGEKEPPKEEPSSKRWDESPDVDSKDLSKVEKQKLLQDRLTRGEITEEEFEKLKSKL